MRVWAISSFKCNVALRGSGGSVASSVQSNRPVQFPTITPIALTRIRAPFDHADWIFELKLDGFRALAYIEDGQCRLVSRRGHVYKAFGQLATAIAQTLEGHSAILDGEIVCLDEKGEPQFARLLYRREPPWFYAFDLLFAMYREAEPDLDLREIPALILANNLFGIDIDLRAAQLAAFSLYLKARATLADVSRSLLGRWFLFRLTAGFLLARRFDARSQRLHEIRHLGDGRLRRRDNFAFGLLSNDLQQGFPVFVLVAFDLKIARQHVHQGLCHG